MHELALCEGVLGVVVDAAGERPVARVRVRIGSRWGVSPASFEQSFQVAAQDTPAAGAVVEQEHVSGDALQVREVELVSGGILRNPELEELEG